jgi:hypothetical protein
MVQTHRCRKISDSGARATPPSKHILLERRCALRRLNWLVLGGIDCYDLVRRSRLPPGSAHLVRDFDSTHAPVRASPRTGVLFYNEKAKAQALGRGAGFLWSAPLTSPGSWLRWLIRSLPVSILCEVRHGALPVHSLWFASTIGRSDPTNGRTP